MILIAYRHGLRVSELVGLRREQVDLHLGLLHVRRRKNGLPSTHPLRGPELRALRQLRRDDPETPYKNIVAYDANAATLHHVAYARRAPGEGGPRTLLLDAGAPLPTIAAHTLRLDHCIGSIEVGKYADFAVLEQDPLEVAPQDLRDVPVWGTVLGGQVFEAPVRAC